jgi:hypothetical protein
MARESDIEKKACAIAQRLGWLVHPKCGVGRRAWPDRTFSRVTSDGRTQLVFVEFKRPGETLRPAQAATRNALKAKGYAHHVIYSVDAAHNVFR